MMLHFQMRSEKATYPIEYFIFCIDQKLAHYNKPNKDGVSSTFEPLYKPSSLLVIEEEKRAGGSQMAISRGHFAWGPMCETFVCFIPNKSFVWLFNRAQN